jgi:hypothetical protein
MADLSENFLLVKENKPLLLEHTKVEGFSRVCVCVCAEPCNNHKSERGQKSWGGGEG